MNLLRRTPAVLFTILSLLVLQALPAGSVLGQDAMTFGNVAPPGNVLRPGHMGRMTGDLERIIHFYHDLIGLGLRGSRDEPRPFWSSPGLIEFANSPEHSQFRAVIMSIPGTAVPGTEGTEMAIEAIEFRNINRHQYVFDLSETGASSLGLVVRDLDGMLERLRAADVPVITRGGEPLSLPLRPGFSGRARAVFVRDPDGFPVELLELESPPPISMSTNSAILGAYITLVVNDIEETQRWYRDQVGPELLLWASPGYVSSTVYNDLRATPAASFRTGTALIPGSPVMMEFIQYRDVRPRSIRPRLQDIGVSHVLFMVADMDLTMSRITAAGLSTLATSNRPVFISPTTSALFVRDLNGYFVEFMHSSRP